MMCLGAHTSCVSVQGMHPSGAALLQCCDTAHLKMESSKDAAPEFEYNHNHKKTCILFPFHVADVLQEPKLKENK